MSQTPNQHKVNNATPGLNDAKLGDVVANLVYVVNNLSVQVAALNTKDAITTPQAPYVVGLEGV